MYKCFANVSCYFLVFFFILKHTHTYIISLHNFYLQNIAPVFALWFLTILLCLSFWSTFGGIVFFHKLELCFPLSDSLFPRSLMRSSKPLDHLCSLFSLGPYLSTQRPLGSPEFKGTSHFRDEKVELQCPWDEGAWLRSNRAPTKAQSTFQPMAFSTKLPAKTSPLEFGSKHIS